MPLKPPQTVTYLVFENVTIEYQTASAFLFGIEGVKYWVPKSVAEYADGTLRLPDWFEMKEAAPRKENASTANAASAAAVQAPRHITPLCPHCGHMMHLAAAWAIKGHPDNIKGACKSCGGFFIGEPVINFVMKEYTPPATPVTEPVDKDKPVDKPATKPVDNKPEIKPVTGNKLKRPKDRVKTEAELDIEGLEDDIPF